MANSESRALAVDVIARIDKLEKGMAKAKTVANDNFRAIERSAGSMVNNVNAKLGNLGKGLATSFLGGLAGGMFVGGLDNFLRGVKNTVSELATLHKTIERVGLSAKTFQELQFGFQLAGVEASAFTDGVDKFNQRIAVAATSGGKLADILGWSDFFLFTTVVTVPALLLLLWMMRRPPQSQNVTVASG